MKIKELQKNWDALGNIDAFGNILTDPAKKGKWKEEEFFKNGEEEISALMQYIDLLGVDLRRKRALDFGCGVGRLSQALCRYFDECCGVDIAPSMIARAKRYNRFGDRCRYYLNDRDDLKLFGDNSFDFVYSNIVLQHMRPEYSKKYIEEFIRVVAPGGLVIFQIPSERTSDRPSPQTAKALPESGFRARIAAANPPTVMRPADSVTLSVRVINTGDVSWPATGDPDGRHWINLGNHWLSREGRILINDDGRASLPRDIAPNEEVELALRVTAPQAGGSYILELDMVQEAVAWFKDKGSATAAYPVHVHGHASRAVQLLSRTVNALKSRLPSRTFSPIMEMYGVPKSEVIELIGEAGGRVVDVTEFNVSGDEWLSYRYCATK
jgi:SAM-dependent methyltransferase